MTARKSERLLNLLITLLVSRTYVSKDRIRTVVEAYREAGEDAFEKMFERDKEELRSLGIPIEVGYVDRAFEDEPGYRIERSAFELPDIDLEPEEAAVIGLAARVWQHAGLAAATSDALVKLKAAGVTVDRAGARRRAAPADRRGARVRAAVGRDPHPHPGAVHLPPLRRHRAGGAPPAAVGRGVFRGRWYVVGHDRDRGEPRVFRLSRVQGEVSARRGARLLRRTPRHRPACRSPPRWPRPRPTAPPRCWCAPVPVTGCAATPSPPPGRTTCRTGWERLTVRYGSTDAFADEVLGYGAEVVLLEPADLRDHVVHRLREAAGQPAEARA